MWCAPLVTTTVPLIHRMAEEKKQDIRVETPIALHSVAHRVSHPIQAESEMSRQNRATAPKSRCRTFLRTPLSHCPLIRSRQGARRAGGGYRGTFGFRKWIALQGRVAAAVTPIALLCATKVSPLKSRKSLVSVK